jgi:dUTP pyrophosphatase
MEESIREQIEELKHLKSLGILDEETSKQIDLALEEFQSLSTKEEESRENYNLQIKFVNKSNNENPTYAKDGDSGFDLRANLSEPVTLKPLERKLIDTGLVFELPKGFDMEVRSRSGLALKNGIMVLNSPGTIDLSYRGNIGVILINLGNEDFTVNNGDRIAQGLIRWSLTNNNIELLEVEEISEDTNRGTNGFGHSGIK